MLLPEELLNKLDEKNIKSIDDWSQEDIYWMLCTNSISKKTKHGKHYLLLEVLGTSGKKYRIFCWNAPQDSKVTPYSVVAAQLQNGDFGFSTKWNKVLELNLDKH